MSVLCEFPAHLRFSNTSHINLNIFFLLYFLNFLSPISAFYLFNKKICFISNEPLRLNTFHIQLNSAASVRCVCRFNAASFVALSGGAFAARRLFGWWVWSVGCLLPIAHPRSAYLLLGGGVYVNTFAQRVNRPFKMCMCVCGMSIRLAGARNIPTVSATAAFQCLFSAFCFCLCLLLFHMLLISRCCVLVCFGKRNIARLPPNACDFGIWKRLLQSLHAGVGVCMPLLFMRAHFQLSAAIW